MSWEAGRLQLPAHPDAEAELVLAALGGEKAGCVRIAEIWGRHTEDLMMLQVGPRGAADEIAVSWDDVPRPGEEAAQALWHAVAGPPVAMSMPMRHAARHGPAQIRQAMQAEMDKVSRRNVDLLSLLALGSAFQFRLAGHVAAAHADRLSAATRPTLGAALSGRFALIAREWIGIDPDRVTVSLREERDRWQGTIGRAHDGGLRAALPAAWLASVWACGLALVGEHLVVAVTRPGWPDAQVLAVREPGADAVLLEVHGTESPGNTAHWET